MSGSGIIRAHGLDGAPRMAVESSRRRIEREDIAFAQANKHRMGWQAMARIRGVNQTDLKMACDRGYSDIPTKAAEKPALPASGRGQPFDPLRILEAIQKGAACLEDISDICHISRSHAGQLIKQLKAEGLLSGHGRGLTGWLVTGAGLIALRKGRSNG